MKLPADPMDPGPTGACDAEVQAACRVVLQNAPTSGHDTEGSFVDRLVEHAQFDAAGCRALEEALCLLAAHPDAAAATDAHVFAIYRLVALQLLCHLNPSDVCGVDNLDDDAAIDLKNRFDFVVGSYFFRQPFDVASWWRDRGDGLAGTGRPA